MFKIMLMSVALLFLAGCTIIEIEGNSNSIADSGNHSGCLTVPDLDGGSDTSDIAAGRQEK